MADRNLRDLLAEIVRTQAAAGPLPDQTQSQLMGTMMLNPYIPASALAPVAHADPRGPSVINRIFDLMSRPLYATANVVKSTVESAKQEIQEDDPATMGDAIGSLLQGVVKQPPVPIADLPAFGRGLAGYDKTTGRDLLEAAGDAEGADTAIAGFALDVGLDPLSWTGIGASKSILGSAARRSIAALRGAERGAGEASQDLASEIARRAALGAEASRVPTVPTVNSPAPAPGAPPRTFMAGPGTPPLQLPLPEPRALTRTPSNFVPLDSTAIAQIKNAVARGVPLEQAALRPLIPSEQSILQQGIQAGTSARQLEQQLTRATGQAPPKPFGAPAALRELSQEEADRITELESQREEILSRIDDLEMQTSGTPSTDVLEAEMRRLESELQRVTPELTTVRDQIMGLSNIAGSVSRGALQSQINDVKIRLMRTTMGSAEEANLQRQLDDLNRQFNNAPEVVSADEKARLTRLFNDLTNQREQLLQRTAAIQEEILESGTIGPSGVTRSIINSEANRLEAEARRLGSEIEGIRRAPEETIPSQAASGAGETIATPVVRAPETVTDLINEVSGVGINWRRMIQRQLSSIPEGASRFDALKILEAQMAATRSPVFRNMIAQQIRKLREGVTPASLVDAARVSPPEFPKITLSSTRKNAANDIADSFLAANKYDEINHVGQTNLFNRVRGWLAKNRIPTKARDALAYQMLRVAEDRILASGKKLVDSEGYSVRLTDVANLAGGSKALTSRLIDDFRSAKPVQAVENVKAANAPMIAQQIIDPVLQTAKSMTQRLIESGAPPSRTVQLGSDMTRELTTLAQQAGASAKEASSARRFMNELFDETRDDLYNEVMQQARGLMRQSMTGKVDPILTNKINNKVYDALRANPKLLGRAAEQTKVVEAIMLRFATWWNAKDLRPFAREYIDTARNVAAAFQRALTPLVRSTTPRQRSQAWSVARGALRAGTSEEQQLADQFRYLMERLVGAEDVTNTRARAESVLVRGGVTMDELNKEMPARFKFVDTKNSDPVTGRMWNYRDGNWMHSWKQWSDGDPAEALYATTRALQYVTRKNSMLDDAAARWAVPVRGGQFNTTVDIPRLRGFYFPEPIAQQLDAVWKRLETDKFHFGGTALQMFDKVQRMWKTGVTIYSPSHHIRNLNGDIFMNMLDGVVTLSPYRKAMQVMHAYRGRYKDIENVFNIMDTDLRDAALKAQPGKVLITTRAGHNLTAEQIYQAAESQGFLLRAQTLEDLIGPESATGTFPGFQPFGGRVHQTAAKASELRDHWVRLAHFINAIQKSKARDLRDVIDEAGRRVKKFHPDGSDLTGFEQNVMRRIIPFYSWLRKATPLVIEGAVMRPHITMLFPKAMANMQAITGIESEGPGDPFPMDQMFPDWIKEKGVGPTIPADSPFANIGRQETWRGDAPGYVVVNPTNPFIDQVAALGNPRQTLISGLTPAARIPIELLTGQTSLGIPLSEVEGGTAGHLAQQVPPIGIGARITGMTRPDEPYHTEQLTNWLLTGGLVTGTGPYRSQAQFEIRELMNELGRQNRS